ncbi:MAG: signal peptidase II [Planctomycetota bacterium]
MPGTDRAPALKREVLFWGLLCAALLLDLGTKSLAFHGYFHRIPMLDHQVMNPGVAFSFGDDLPNRRVILSTASLVLAAILLFFRYRIYDLRTDIIIALLLGGALGNLYDRILFGMVRDFIQWPTFNLADVFVCAGAALFIIEALYRKGGGDGDGNKGTKT